MARFVRVAAPCLPFLPFAFCHYHSLSALSLSLPPLLLYIASPSRRAVAFPPFVYLYARSSTLFPPPVPAAACGLASFRWVPARATIAPLPQGLRAEPLPLSVGGIGKHRRRRERKNTKPKTPKNLLELSLPAHLIQRPRLGLARRGNGSSGRA